jgi:PAS domain S-box-containing protein
MHEFLVHDATIILTLDVTFAITLLINRKGNSLAAAYMFVSTCIILTSVAAVVSGGVTTPAMMTYPPTIFAGGILFGKRGGIVTAIVCISITLIMLVLQVNGLLPASPLFKNPAAYWLGFVAAALVMSVLQYIVNHQTSLAFDRITHQEERYHSLIEQASDPILLLNEDTSINEVNSSACKVLGYTRDELLQMKLADVFTREELDRRPLQVAYLQQHKTLLTERQWRTKDGKILDMEVHTKVLEGQGYLSIARDITERKLIEKRLRESETKYRRIFENLLDVFFQTSIDGIILDMSPSIESHTGYTKEDLIGTRVLDIYYDKSQRADFLKLLQDTGEVKDCELKFKAKSGELVYISVSAKLISSTDGTPAHIDGVFNNITERKMTEIELRQSEEKHRALTENLSDAIILINEAGQIVYESAAVGRIGGYILEDNKEETIFEFIHPDDVQRGIDLFKKAQALPGVPLSAQLRSRHKEGHYIWIEGTITNLLDNESVGAFIINYHDITERVKYLIDIEEQNKKLREIAWIQSHVVRAPLASMMGLVNVIKDMDMSSDEFKTWIGYFNTTAEEMDAIVHDISVKAKDIPINP